MKPSEWSFLDYCGITLAAIVSGFGFIAGVVLFLLFWGMT